MQEKILKRVQVNMPFHSLYRQYLPMVVEKSINPEICFSHDDIENFMVQDYVRVAEVLLDHGLTVTFHAPFMDLRPGAVDQKIRQASIERLMQVFEIAPFFRPNCIVCHPSFDDRYYVSTEEAWSKTAWTRGASSSPSPKKWIRRSPSKTCTKKRLINSAVFFAASTRRI